MRYVEVADTDFRTESHPWRAVFRCIKTAGGSHACSEPHVPKLVVMGGMIVRHMKEPEYDKGIHGG